MDAGLVNRTNLPLSHKSSLAAVHDDRGQQLAQDLLCMPGYETKMAGARNHVQSVVRQLRGHILGSRGKDHVIGLAVPDADMRCDVLQRKTPIPHFECE